MLRSLITSWVPVNELSDAGLSLSGTACERQGVFPLTWFRRLLRRNVQNPQEFDRQEADSVDASGVPPQRETEAPNDIVYDHTEQNNDGAIYEVHRTNTREAALAYLRKREVKRELYYVIVETAQGNVGKDLIMIFEEKDGRCIELGVRQPLAEPRPSPTDCARCGYPVKLKRYSFPSLPHIEGPSIVQRIMVFNHGEELANGTGYQCRKCGNLSCAICYGPQDTLPRDPAGQPHLTCWCCSGEMGVYFKEVRQ